MPKRKKTKRTTKTKKTGDKSKILTYITWILSIVAFSLVALLFGYYLGYNNAAKEEKKSPPPVHLKKQELRKLPTKPKDTIESVDKRLKEILKKEAKPYNSAAHEIESETLVNPPKLPITKPKYYVKKAKLAIIIDDVQTASQVRAIKSLHLPLTMSFLPPRPGRPNSAKLAAKEPFYMVHLPLEAMHFNASEPDTLRANDSQQTISQRVDFIKKEFPKVHYINNHTGSKFTSSKIAMKRLIVALNENHIHFIDSRTTAKTKAPFVEKEFGLKYVARDVFLDHHMDKVYILGQIKEAIAIAKAHGHAIAIGHPHKNTLEALAESKPLFKDVELVLINKIY